MRIAKLYGKASGEAVLRLLRREGIPRRDPAEICRKVSKETLDEWVKRYVAGESMQQIVGNKLSVGTMREHLLKRGVRIRPTGEARRTRRMRRDAALFG